MKNCVSFRSDGDCKDRPETFDFEVNKLDICPYLNVLSKKQFKVIENGGVISSQIDKESLYALSLYVNCGKVNEHLTHQLAEYTGISLPPDGTKTEFERIWLTENWQRRFTQNNPRVDKMSLKDCIGKIKQNIPLYSSDMVVFPIKSCFEINNEVKNAYKTGRSVHLIPCGIDVRKYKGQLVLAGGSLLCYLLNRKVADYDFFFVNCDLERAKEIASEIITRVLKNHRCRIIINQNSWTLSFGSSANRKCLQFIFRGYKNVDEILLGFDVDSCCIVYDGSDIYVSQRWRHAVENHVNIVDLTRASPTYEYRLSKYATRGFGIHVPGFDESNLNVKKLIKDLSLLEVVNLRVDASSGTLVAKSRTIQSPYNWSQRYKNKSKSYNTYNIKTGQPTVSVDSYDESSSLVPGETFNIKKAFGRTDPKFQWKGLDALLIITRATHSYGGPIRSVSDYTSTENEKIVCYSSWKHNNITWCPYKWVCIDTCKSDPSTYSINDLLDIAIAKGINTFWKTQDVGEQITSSFHAQIKTQQDWLDGKYYRCKPEKEINETHDFILLPM